MHAQVHGLHFDGAALVGDRVHQAVEIEQLLAARVDDVEHLRTVAARLQGRVDERDLADRRGQPEAAAQREAAGREMLEIGVGDGEAQSTLVAQRHGDEAARVGRRADRLALERDAVVAQQFDVPDEAEVAAEGGPGLVHHGLRLGAGRSARTGTVQQRAQRESQSGRTMADGHDLTSRFGAPAAVAAGGCGFCRECGSAYSKSSRKIGQSPIGVIIGPTFLQTMESCGIAPEPEVGQLFAVESRTLAV